MAYLQNNVNMPFSNGADVYQSIPVENGISEVHQSAFNKEAPFARVTAKTDGIASVNPLDIKHALTGKYLNQNSYHLFYYRIIASKSVYDFGIVTGDKAETFNVFNGYPEPITLNSITEIDISGVSIVSSDGKFPITIQPFRSIDLRMQLSSQGSAQLNGSFVLNFSNGDTLTLSVKGSRLVLWNVKPNWGNAVREQFEYKTDIMTSYNKKEQRRGFMTQPRRRISYSAIVEKMALMNLRNMLHGWQDKIFMMPLWWQPARLAKSVTSGSTQVVLSGNEKFDFVVGGSFVIWLDEKNNEVLEIKAVDGNNITLGSPISNSFDENTLAYPSVKVRMNEEMAITANSSTVASLDVEAIVIMQNLNIKMPEKASQIEAMYNGVEVLERNPNWAEELNETYTATVDTLDYSYGVQQWLTRNVPSLVTREMQFVAKSYDDILWWKAFIHRQKGALKSFIVPTHTFDISIENDALQGSNSLLFRDDYISTIVKTSNERKYLRVKTKKKVYYFTVTSVKNSNQDVSVTIAETLNETIFKEDVLQISFMQRMRFAGDAVEIEYISRNVAKLSLTLQQVREI